MAIKYALMLIKCQTRFDITVTDVKNNFNKNRMPFRDATGRTIDTETAWNYARNQQRNWETLTQVISLRTLPANITQPVSTEINGIKYWNFEFEIEGNDVNGLDLLKADCADVPMLTGLTETPVLESTLFVGRNIDFTSVDV